LSFDKLAPYGLRQFYERPRSKATRAPNAGLGLHGKLALPPMDEPVFLPHFDDRAAFFAIELVVRPPHGIGVIRKLSSIGAGDAACPINR
jgi:hypothetical protein